MARIHFLTGNEGKVAEAKHHLEPLGHDVVQLSVEGIVEPQADELETVARAKLEQAKAHLPNQDDWLMVEDAGLFVEALDGFPGVYSSYALSTLGCHGLLRLLDHLHSDDLHVEAGLRRAEFKAIAALMTPDGIFIGEGACMGRIAPAVDGEGGFGFDPVFIPRDLDLSGAPAEIGVQGEVSTHGRTFAAVDMDLKAKFSHRTEALQDLLSQLGISE
ncbi:MAG TPA: non-canonical purine NTP pyrophosphatase [Candidatus Poseidoniaceae archaeon]|nr:MAG TPA: non-canonical purine NTP pyrophosphatase [Candidatus Poseidoniales archaeon]DAC15670.1 MAG TPA: non-canonical purine NTP pyrophosphatase [Candidatus Poseidoniales archaeon]HII19014.1 non-canonical purine NTP pyrophosphatase [Candidatus Poseidoniaceae archaeon]HII97471.1 non-canonical purine NTP pyrophosphatase [Candidatus Poseidoniaceae archaeon]|tara:strand:+ start:1924 stop:2574 length:651 start_codon:yes stop_codon:yes gene_type:complete